MKNNEISNTSSDQTTTIAIIDSSAAEQAKEIETAIKNMTPAEILDIVGYYLDTTDVVMEGVTMAKHLDVGQATLVSALMRTRDGLQKVTAWLAFRYDLHEESEDVPDDKPATNGIEEYL